MKVQSKTKKMTFLAVMLGITIVMDVVPFLGVIPLGAFQATIVHIPTIITGIVLGPIYGLVMGTLFGLVSLLHALTRPMAVTDAFFLNPLVSVLPRMLIGLFAGLVYLLLKSILKDNKKPISIGISAGIGSLTNTFFVLLALYLVYAKELVEAFGLEDATALKAMFIGVATSIGLVEMAVCIVLVIPIVMAYYKFIKGRGGA